VSGSDTKAHASLHHFDLLSVFLEQFCVTKSVDANEFTRVKHLLEIFVVDVHNFVQELKSRLNIRHEGSFKAVFVGFGEVGHHVLCQSLYEGFDVDIFGSASDLFQAD